MGDGSSINVWFDPLLKDDNNFRLETPLDVEFSSMNVQDLMIPGCWKWDVECIKEIFSIRDYAAILSIPLCYGTVRFIVFSWNRWCLMIISMYLEIGVACGS